MRHWRFIVKITISILLISWLISNLDINTAWKVLQSFNGIYFFPLFMLNVIGIFLSVWKWWLVIHTSAKVPSLGFLTKLFWVGLFFNNFMPGRTGGDVIRAYGLTQKNQQTAKSMISVLTDRLLNFFALLILCLISFLCVGNLGDFTFTFSDLNPWWLLVTAFIGPMIWLIFKNSKPIQKFTLPIRQALRASIEKRHTLFAAFILAIVYQITMILSHVIVSKGLGQHIGLTHFFYLIPITAIVTLLPISINGIGLREGAFVVTFSLVGLATEEALSLSLIITLTTLLTSLIGGWFYITNPIFKPSSHSATYDSAYDSIRTK